ncbi:MAG: YgjP-like metallopeptidase domain-containing protein [Bacteroidaceae bacterium]
MQELEFQDSELGKIIVKTNPRACHIIFRTRPDAVYVTVPLGVSRKEMENALERYRAKLLVSKKKVKRENITLEYKIETEYFKLSMVQGHENTFFARSKPGDMQIICPPTADFFDEDLQAWLRKVIEESLRRNAKNILPLRLAALSQEHHLPYKEVKINSSQGRWGSCSAQKTINLSFYLMLLPGRLVDYVLLHELSHTQEMNHGPNFWLLLNKLTNNKALVLRNELKKYRTNI